MIIVSNNYIIGKVLMLISIVITIEEVDSIKYFPPIPKRNTKLLEFTNEIREVVEKKSSGSPKTSGGRVTPRIVSVITDKEGFLVPVVKEAIGGEGSSLVTWSNLVEIGQ